ncbi:hypothetical protein LSTR_LSTR000146 [Laodelphax striatellus]|uniref:Ciliogenesis and planar polarity effector 2 n=1 Tax=Laodelphax striatellus TaxID=195883 RepID=A0A482X6X3_LAOST|nr:hypothetical protein LSTR_LSTR000146 [Laodelphax striatellus]
MDQMPAHVVGSIVQMDWHSTAEGETVLQHFYNPQTSGRKLFGLLERPPVAPHIEEVSYKLFFAGKAGVGKTATISRLAGTLPPAGYIETTGIRKTNIYWPVKIWDKIILFRLQCWDAGEHAVKKYGHIFPSCKAKSDGVVIIFSFMDESSFAEVPNIISKVTKDDQSPPAVMVFGTRFCLSSKLEVSLNEIKEFEQKYHVNVMKVNKVTSISHDRNEVHRTAPLLNAICEKLWIRDQEYILKNGMTV